jgi:hypothetical protein
MSATDTRRLVAGGPKERAKILRDAEDQERTVSVGYRKGGMLEVEDLTGCTIYVIAKPAPQEPREP